MTTEGFALSARELALIRRGYDRATVEKYCLGVTEYADTVAERIAGEFTGSACAASAAPVCLLLGGQPGSGKSVYSRRYIRGAREPYTVIGIDDYRCYHPFYRQLEEEIRRHWAGCAEGADDTPGNDMADFTHRFAGRVTDAVISRCRGQRRNMIIEWGLRMPDEPLMLMRLLKQDGYTVKVKYIAVHKSVSYEACRMRADIMALQGHIMRRVPREFHELAVKALPDSCQRLYAGSVLENSWCDEFQIIDRRGNILWQTGCAGDPATVYRSYLEDICEDSANAPEEAQLSTIREMRGLSGLQ